MMQTGNCQQRRYRRELLVHAAIAEDEDVDLLLFDHAPRSQAQFFQSLGQTGLAARRTEQNRQHADLESRQLHMTDAREIFVGQDRPVELQLTAIRRTRREEVAPRAKQHLTGGDQFLADAVDRRIGDLREQLLEIVVQQTRLVRQRRQRRVVAHRPGGLNAQPPHRVDQQALVFEGVAEGNLPMHQGVVIDHRQRTGRRQILDRDQMIAEELAIGPLGGNLTLDFLVFDDASLLGVDQEHATRLQAALADHILRREIQYAGLRGHDHQIVLGHVVA